MSRPAPSLRTFLPFPSHASREGHLMSLHATLPRLLALVILGATSAPAAAMNFCVDTDAQLRAAFAAAAGNGQNDEIRIRAKTLSATAAMASQHTYRTIISDGLGLRISGGWTDAACLKQTLDPALTVLTPFANRALIGVEANAPVGNSALFAVVNLTLSGILPGQYSHGCAVSYSGNFGVMLDRIVIRDNDCTESLAYLPVDEALLIVRNNLFASNATGGVVVSGESSGANTPLAAHVTNNTFVGNVLPNSGIAVQIENPAFDLTFENNVFADNTYSPHSTNREFSIFGATSIRNNHTQFHQPALPQALNTHGDAGFVGPNDFRPRKDSILRDNGMDPPSSGGQPTDIAGSQRRQGTRLDIGAYEFSGIFDGGFE